MKIINLFLKTILLHYLKKRFKIFEKKYICYIYSHELKKNESRRSTFKSKNAKGFT